MNRQAVLEMAVRARDMYSNYINDMIRNTKRMRREFARFQRTVSSYARKIIAAVQKMQAAFMKLRQAMRTLWNAAKRAFAALVAFTSIPIYKFAKFEKAMTNVNTLLDTSEQKFQELSDGVVEVSNRVGESATKLSNALYDIVSAGVDASNSIAVLNQSSRAARAGMTETQTAVKAGLSTINAYNLAIDELTKVYDLQFQTVRKGVITYEELANAQGQLLPSARKLNESLENMYGSLSFVTKAGLNADEATTALARTYDQLIKKSSNLADAGIRIYDEFGKFRGIVDIMEDLNEQLEGLSDQEMQNVLQDIGFEIRAARAIVPMITNIEGLKESIEAMEDSSGSMEEAFEKATDNIAFHFNRAKENVINAVRGMGSAFGDEIQNMLDDIAAWAGAIQGFVEDNKEAIKSILSFALRLTGTIAAFTAVGMAIMSLTTPIGAVTVGIAALGAAWYLNLWDIRGVTENVVNRVQTEWEDFRSWWENTTWMEKAHDIGELLLNFGGFVWNNIEDLYTTFKNWLIGQLDLNENGEVSFNEAIRPLLTFGSFIWTNISNLYDKFHDWIINQLDIDENGEISFDELIEPINPVLEFGSFLWKEGIDLAIKLDQWVGEQLDLNEDNSIDLGDLTFAFYIIWNSINGILDSFDQWMQDQELNTGNLWETVKSIWNSNLGDTLKVSFVVAWSATKIPSLITYLIGAITPLALSGGALAFSLGKLTLTAAIIWSILPEDWKQSIDESIIKPVRNYFKDNQPEFDIGEINISDNIPEFPGKEFIEIALKWTGETYKAIKKGFETGDWSDAFKIGAEIWKKGVIISVVLSLAKGTITSLLAQIRAGLGLIAGTASGLGGPSMLGLMSIGVQLLEIKEAGKSFEEFGKNLIIAIAAGSGAALIGGPQAGVLAFTVALNLDLGKNWDILESLKGLMIPGYVSEIEENTQSMKSSLDHLPEENPNLPSDRFKAQGGLMRGPGTGTSDSIPAMLSNGEFVVNAKATREWLPLLKAINSGEVPGFAMGGQVGQSVDPSVVNQWTLSSAGLENNEALNYLAKVAKDTENFQHIVDLVSGMENMKKEYQNQVESLKTQEEELRGKLEEELEKIQNNQEDQTEEFTASISDLTNQIASFANNLGNITGNEEEGSLISGLMQSGQQGYNQFKNFQNATGMMSKLTAGFGMANAALGAVAAFKQFNEARNQREHEEWKKQQEISRKQLEKLQTIQENTQKTANNIIQSLSENSTTSNIEQGREVLDDLYDNLKNRLTPDFSDISFNVKEDDLFFDDEKTVNYSPKRLLDRLGVDMSEYGINTSIFSNDSISDLDLDQLKEINNQVKSISRNDLKGIAQDIADTMDIGSGELKSFSTNFDDFENQLQDYINTITQLQDKLGNLTENVRMESFTGVEFLDAADQIEQYRKKVEEYYTLFGKNLEDHKNEIDAMVENYADNMVDGGKRIITIMQEVRQSFVSTFAQGNDLLDSFTSSAKSYFDSLKQNIAGLFYDIELDQIDQRFKEVFGNITDKLASYSGNNVMEYADQLLSGNDVSGLFDDIIEMQKNSNDISTINEMLADQFRDQAEAAGMTDSEITKALENLGLAAEEAANQMKKFTGQAKNAPSGFKQARFGYRAADPETSGDTVTISGNTFIVEGDDPEEVIEKIKKMDKNANIRENGTPAGSTLPGG